MAKTKRHVCRDCKRTIEEPKGSCGTGYATMRNGWKICYACCGIRDRREMIRTGKAILYLAKDREIKLADGSVTKSWQVSNWPGTLTFRTDYVSIGNHNIARVQRNFWFAGPDGFMWHGRNVGYDSELARCKRTQERI